MSDKLTKQQIEDFARDAKLDQLHIVDERKKDWRVLDLGWPEIERFANAIAGLRDAEITHLRDRLAKCETDLGVTRQSLCEVVEQRNKALAELATIKRQEPVGSIIDEDGYGPAAHFPFGFPPRGTKLYTQPVVAEIAIKGQEPVAWAGDDAFGEQMTDSNREFLVEGGYKNIRPLYALPVSNKDVEILRNALERIRPIPELLLKKIPVRNLDEVLAECDAAMERRNDEGGVMLACPKCGREWEEPCEQTSCIELYGECIPCRFIPVGGEINKHGSGAGTDLEIDAIRKATERRE